MLTSKNMKRSKKLRIDNKCQKLCQICEISDELKSEAITLTDPRLMSLYPSSEEPILNSDIPQFRITDFTIHDSDRRFCWFDSKPIEKGYQLFLCGYVRPIVSNPDSDIDGFNDQIMAQIIGPLQEWWFAGFDGGTNVIIGVESEFASYILCEPNADYFQLFNECTKNMFLTKLIIESLLKNPDLSYEDLIINIEEREERGQHFTQQSIMQFSTFIVDQIKSFDSAAEGDEMLLSETPAFKTLVDLSGISSKNVMQSKSTHISHVRPIARMDARRMANSDTLTCSTPLVTKFFDSVFKDVIECEANNSEDINKIKRNSSKNKSQILSNNWIKKLNWIGNSVYEDRIARTTYYSSLKIDDKTYKIGDFINFRTNDNSLKLGRIMFMFSTSDKTKFCHIHYFCYGKDTILGETAPKFMVFMTNDCNNIFAEQIDNKMDIILSKELESIGTQSETYLCSKLYYKKCGRFEDLPKQTFDSDIKCINCLNEDKNQKQNIPQLIEEITTECSDSLSDSSLNKYNQLIYKNVNYSVGDSALFSSDAFPINYFNYENNEQIPESDQQLDQTLYPERYRKKSDKYIKGLNNDLPKTLNIGLIDEIFKQSSDSTEETRLLVHVFYRPQNIYQNYSDFRRCDLNLVFWSDHQIVVGIDSLRGKCQVFYSNKSLETNIYLETKLFYFSQCFDEKENSFSEPNVDLINRFVDNSCRTQCPNKLNVLDLFAGCGGMSYGFHKLGLISKLWAIEKDSSAIKSFRANFESSQVFEEDVNHFLDQVIKGAESHSNGIEFPKKGQIDLILGGPPCQGFSGMNRFSSRHYSLFKNSLVVSFLSFVDFYRPKYLILENVRNFSIFESSMILKITLSCLISMGYQCHFAILQAGSYGLPQTRRRTVIIGASSGNDLPLFPEPTHVFSRRRCHLSVTIDNKKYCGLTTQSGPFRTITVDDAISDLPELSEDYAINKVREYPLNRDITHYQRIMRTDSERQLFQHYCKELSELCRLRIENIPQTMASDWRDLPNISLILSDGTLIPKLKYIYEDSKNGRSQSNERRGVCHCAQQITCKANECRQENTLIPWCLVHTANRQYNWSGLYGRLVLNGYFPTTVTNPEPISKQGRVLHPNQNRIISIRESARSQGFPDSFVLCGSVSEKYRQIGNAVPIPLSFALSRQFLNI